MKKKPTNNTKPLNEKGKNPFQVKFINKSYRKRGSVTRTQINTKQKNKTFKHKNKSNENMSTKDPPKKRQPVSKLISKMLAYSAIKIKAKPPAPYSTLNPDTNSDSPSAKPKGARFVSAIQETSQTRPIGKRMKLNQTNF